jgi:hypothetical protein
MVEECHGPQSVKHCDSFTVLASVKINSRNYEYSFKTYSYVENVDIATG